MRIVHRSRYRRQQVCGQPEVAAEALQLLGQAAAFDELHAEVVQSLVLADLVDWDNVGMVEMGGGLGLALEALHVLVGGQLSGEDHLKGHGSVEADLAGLVDDAHAAAGNLFLQLIVAKVTRLFPQRGRNRCARGAFQSRRLRARGLQETTGLVVSAEQVLDALAQGRVAGAGGVEEAGAVGVWLVAGLVEQGLFGHGETPGAGPCLHKRERGRKSTSGRAEKSGPGLSCRGRSASHSPRSRYYLRQQCRDSAPA